jgi:AraC-like DNA-binding protein
VCLYPPPQMPPSRVLSSQCVPLFLQVLRHRGLPLAGLRKEYGLEASVETWAEAGLPLPRVGAFADDCAALAKDPHFGLHLGASLERGAYGLLEFAVRTSPTLREGMLQLQRYSVLLNGLVTIELEETRRFARLIHRIEGEPGCVGRQCNEFTLAVFHRRAKEMTGGKLVVDRAQFANPAPADLAALKKVFGPKCALDFDAGANALVFARSWLDHPTLEADAALSKVLEAQAAREAKGRPRSSDLRSTVRGAIREELRGQTPALPSVARRLAVSERTLQRRLDSEGSSFQVELESVRQSLAQSYVKQPEIPFAEIAFALRYSDLRSFARAFKRWTGKTLAQSRR